MKRVTTYLLAIIFVLISIHSKSQQLNAPDYSDYILTPAPPLSPRINGPSIYGVRPDSPFLYRIPCTGERPINFYVEGLPAGMSSDEKKGFITGSTDAKGIHKVIITAKNKHGKDTFEFKIMVGDKLALTPPMGWNSWYIHYDRISDATMREAADQMIATGMAEYGYQYVNIDDCWMRKLDSKDPGIGGKRRDENNVIIPNGRFPDMNAMTEYIHSKGLKAGLYISPGPSTCAGYEGSWGNEALDARTFASWEFDFLKYDWCSYRKKAKDKSREEYIKPYKIMWGELNKLDRDIVLNLCQYGMDNVWEWGAEVGNCWRTTGDLGLERGGDLPGFYHIGFSNAEHWQLAQPGGWNDPDYILIGWVGNAHEMAEGTPTALTPHEQYSYMSMWCLMAAPLIFSGDMAKLDNFTLNVLCNHEVIAVDQDPLGQQARIVRKNDRDFVLVKDMSDGSKAVGIFSLVNQAVKLSVKWKELSLKGDQQIRDLWRQKDIGTYDKIYSTEIPAHGVSMIRIWPDN
ncbi:glycoside hydrolase family 27 protein [Bacteroidota bacterium]